MLVAWTESRDGGSGYAEADFRRELVPIVDTYPFYTLESSYLVKEKTQRWSYKSIIYEKTYTWVHHVQFVRRRRVQPIRSCE